MILPPTTSEADAGYVIMEQVEYSADVGLEHHLRGHRADRDRHGAVVEPVTELTLETPAGIIRVRAAVRDGKCESVTFRNVPAYAAYLDRTIEVPELGSVTVDVGWGGMFYVIAEAARFGFELTPDEGADITRVTEMIKAAAREQLPVVHPETPRSATSRSAQLCGPAHAQGATAKRRRRLHRHFDWDVRRAGLARSTARHAAPARARRWRRCTPRGSLRSAQDFVHEWIIGSVFTGRLVEQTTLGAHPAVVPTSRQAWITGIAQYSSTPTIRSRRGSRSAICGGWRRGRATASVSATRPRLIS